MSSQKTKPLCLDKMLKEVVALEASDLHLTPNTPPRARVHGTLTSLDYLPLTDAQTRELAYSVMTNRQKRQYENSLQVDFSFGIKDLARFRANIFTQKGSTAAVFRTIPLQIKGFEELRLPPVIEGFCEKPRGLILITGPTGSGKSTTLAAMVDRINRKQRKHIVTIEDPIEFVHSHNNSIVNQREIHSDANSFADALRVVLREDPDVVMVGEMRDLETIESALRVAETGHLTLATLHTNSAASTITRIIDVFPPHQQQQIRVQLAMVLEGIACQTLLPRSDGSGRVPAIEVLVPNTAIRNLIRDNKVHQIYSAMQSGQDIHRMQTMNQALAELLANRLVTRKDCLDCSSNRKELMEILRRSGVVRFQS